MRHILEEQHNDSHQKSQTTNSQLGSSTRSETENWRDWCENTRTINQWTTRCWVECWSGLDGSDSDWSIEIGIITIDKHIDNGTSQGRQVEPFCLVGYIDHRSVQKCQNTEHNESRHLIRIDCGRFGWDIRYQRVVVWFGDHHIASGDRFIQTEDRPDEGVGIRLQNTSDEDKGRLVEDHFTDWASTDTSHSDRVASTRSGCEIDIGHFNFSASDQNNCLVDTRRYTEVMATSAVEDILDDCLAVENQLDCIRRVGHITVKDTNERWTQSL